MDTESVLASQATPTTNPTATPTTNPTATPRPTATPTTNPTATPRPTATPTTNPSATPRPTATPTTNPTATPRPTATPTTNPTATPRPTATPAPTATPSPGGNTPTISSVSGSAQESSLITIRGSGFGQNSRQIEWLGGRDGAIESGVDGQEFVATTRRPGWQEVVSPSRFDDDHFYSHGKSLIFDSSLGDGRFGLGYDTGGDIQFAYVSYYTYFDNTGLAAGQWKMYRVMPLMSVVDRDTPQLVVFNKRVVGGASGIEWRPQTAPGDQEWLPNTGHQLPDAGSWHRMEIILKPSSNLGVSDGWGKVLMHRPGLSVEKVYDKSNLLSYGASDNRKWRVHMFQNYQGNGYGTDVSSGTKVWMDDIYISSTQARVEICNSSRWSTCLHREVQYPTAWQNGEITIRYSRGGFPNDNGLYIFVIDANGAVNEVGYPLN